MKNIHLILIGLALIGLLLAGRLLPHPANFAPVGAIALFAGLYLPKRWGILTALAGLLVSDLVLGFYDWKIMLAVYLSFFAMLMIGRAVRRHKNVLTVVGGTLLGSLLFFLATNFAVWAFGTLYPHTLPGLGLAYTMAIPFFKNSIAGDLFYVGALVGSVECIAVASRIPSLAYRRNVV